MSRSILNNALVVATIGVLLSFDLPSQWLKRGSSPDKYEMQIEKGKGYNQSKAGTIKSLVTNGEGFGTLMQVCMPGEYLGKRVRLTGFMKTRNVLTGASFWMRVDEADTRSDADSVKLKTVSFDNMQDRWIKGTKEWNKYEIILDVPAEASRISYGAMLVGTGEIWFDDLSFQIVDGIDVTKASHSGRGFNMPKKKYNDETPLAHPSNLNFEK